MSFFVDKNTGTRRVSGVGLNGIFRDLFQKSTWIGPIASCAVGQSVSRSKPEEWARRRLIIDLSCYCEKKNFSENSAVFREFLEKSEKNGFFCE